MGSAATGELKGDVYFVYDGDCPICTTAAHALRIREAVGPLHLINAREGADQPLVKEVTALGYDLDEGMVIKFAGRYYHGANALGIMALLGSEVGWFNRINGLLFRFKPVATLLYPPMRATRNALISIKGIPKLNNLATSELKDAPILVVARQRFLVAGGTGFIGRPLCQLLIDQGHDVTIVTRSPNKAQHKFIGPVTFINNADELHSDHHFDVIINLVGEPVAQLWATAAKTRIIQSRVKSIYALARYVKRATLKPNLFLQSSAIGIYGLSEEAVFEEATPLATEPASFSEEICVRVEEVTADVAQGVKRLCNLRIGIGLGWDGGILPKLLLPHKIGLSGAVGSGNQWMSWIHRDDIIGLIYHVINDDNLNGPVNVTAPEPVQQKQFSKTLQSMLSSWPLMVPIPRGVIALVLGAMGKELLLSGQRVLPRKAEATGYQFRYPTLDGALRSIINKDSITDMPIFQRIFGEAWQAMPPVLHQHYANRPFTRDTVIVEGIMEVRASRWIQIFAPLLKWTSLLVPYQGQQVPTTVIFRSEPDSRAFCFDREFHFPGKAPYHFRSRMVPVGDNEVIEYMSCGIGWRAAYRFADNKVTLTHRGYVWRVWGFNIPMPMHWFFGKGSAWEEATGESSFRMHMDICHPWFGEVYAYAGSFEVKEVRLDA